MNIFVVNIAWKAEDSDIQKLFEGFGVVKSAKIIRQKDSNKSKGFGFVEMEDSEQANAAIAGLNGTDFMGRTLVVKEAEERKEKPEYKDKGGYKGNGGGYKGKGGYKGNGGNKGGGKGKSDFSKVRSAKDFDDNEEVNFNR
jgi:RNA recognition motif-containing protein